LLGIEQLVANRVRQWLLDPGSIYQAISAWLPEPSAQQQLVVRAAEIGRQWSELPPARTHTVLTALIERVEVRVERGRLGPYTAAGRFDTTASVKTSATGQQPQLVSQHQHRWYPAHL
jgi:hypothetical protein